MPKVKSKKRSKEPKVAPGTTPAALLAASGKRTWLEVQYKYASCLVRSPVTAMQFWHHIKGKDKHFQSGKAKRDAFNQLTSEEKKPFTVLAARDFARFEAEMVKWYTAWLNCM